MHTAIVLIQKSWLMDGKGEGNVGNYLPLRIKTRTLILAKEMMATLVPKLSSDNQATANLGFRTERGGV